MKLGKKPARLGSIRFRLTDYVDLSKLPTPPADFGHGDSLSDWSMFANDTVGDCVFAGAAHETMLWRKQGGIYFKFTDSNVLSDYSALTGYNPADPNTDQGTDMQQAAEYRRTVGIVDALGWRHRIVAYLALQVGNLAELYVATYLFDAVGFGFRFPASAMDQFDKGQPWDVVTGSPIEGGHYVPVVGRRNGLIDLITWGKLQTMTERFAANYCDEVVAYLTVENLRSGKTPEGFDFKSLRADLAALAPAPAPTGLALHGGWFSDPLPDAVKALTRSVSRAARAIDGLTAELKQKPKPRIWLFETSRDEKIKKG